MIREIELTDVVAIAKFLKGLGYNASQASLEEKLNDYKRCEGFGALIQIEEETVNGIMGLQVLNPLHSKGKVGRITTLVVDESYRGNQAGKMLAEAADEFFKNLGCTSCEITGSIMNTPIKNIFSKLGYKSDNRYFSKRL